MAKMRDTKNDFFNSRLFFMMMVVALFLTATIARYSGCMSHIDRGFGVFWALTSDVIEGAGTFINLMCIIVTAILMMALNHMYSFVRTFNSFIYAAMFIMLEIANPLVCTQFYVGTVMCLVLVVALFFIFEQYGMTQTSQQSIFMTFAALSLCCAFHYAFTFLIPVVIVAFIYMRATDIRGYIAMLLGIITPYWILLGLGFADISQLHWPDLRAMWSAPPQPKEAVAIVMAVVTALMTVVVTLFNFRNMSNFGIQTRAYNALFVLLSIFTIVVMCIDYQDVLIYVPVMNLCLATQAAHLYTDCDAKQREVLMMTMAAVALVSLVAHIIAM